MEYGEYSRSGITAPDSVNPDPFPCEPAITMRLGAWCNQPNAIMTVNVYILNSVGLPVSTIPIVFSSGSIYDFVIPGSTGPWMYTAQGDVETWFPLCGGKSFIVKVMTVNRGTWSIAGCIS